MKKILYLSVGLACSIITLVAVLQLRSTRAEATPMSPVATEVKTVSGTAYVDLNPGYLTIPWPSYADGTPATAAQSSFIVSAKEPRGTISIAGSANPAGLTINAFPSDPETHPYVYAHYLIVCTRNAGTLAVEESGADLPLSLSVAPNPTVHAALVQFTLPGRDRVSVEVFDVAGRMVRQLMKDVPVEGRTSLSWDLRDERGAAVESGVYLVKLQSSSATATRKLTLTH